MEQYNVIPAEPSRYGAQHVIVTDKTGAVVAEFWDETREAALINARRFIEADNMGGLLDDLVNFDAKNFDLLTSLRRNARSLMLRLRNTSTSEITNVRRGETR